MIDSNELARIITEQLRVPFTGSSKYQGGHQILSLRFADLPVPNGFSIDFTPLWRRIEGVLVLDTYSGPVVEAMGNVGGARRAIFEVLSLDAIARGLRLDVAVNDINIDLTGPLPGPPWRRLKIQCSKLTAASIEGPDAIKSELIDLSIRFSTLLISLLPFEEEITQTESALPEGAKMRVEVNRYERSLVNRAACIAVHGVKCVVCGLDFVDRYGEIGRGYIEVHHLVPVSKMGESRIVNPVQDLIPLCANCHAMVHRVDPPIPPEVLCHNLKNKN